MMDENVTIPEITIPVMWGMREAAAKTGLSYDHIRKLCLRHEIKWVAVGDSQRKRLVNAESLISWMNGNQG